jgi:hypothetical protein
MISKSKNKLKTTWKIIKKETGNNDNKKGVLSLKVNNTITNNQLTIADTFNKYLSVADTIIDDNINKDKNEPANNINLVNYLIHNFKYPFTKIKWHYTSTNEIRKIIKSLKARN